MACLDVVQALQAPHETTISRLLDAYELDSGNLLESYSELHTILETWSVKLDPPLGVGAPNDVRVLSASKRSGLEDLIEREIEEGEGQRVEFKQTLGMDVKKHKIGGKPANECFSDDVVLSSLKTIAGFLNSGGGILLIGVCDDGAVVSIEQEFICVCPKDNQSQDGWELRLRGLIERYFVDGPAIQPYIQVGFAQIGGEIVARLLIGARNKLSFMSKSGSDTLYLRVSNRTQVIPYREIEQFFDMSKRV